MPTFNLKLNNTPSSNSKQSNILNKTLAKTKDNLELEEDDPKVLSYYQLLSIYTKGAKSKGSNDLNSVFNNLGSSTSFTPYTFL